MEKERTLYTNLNSLAQVGGLVILGGDEDKAIPLCELKQAFDLQGGIYNRSVSAFSVHNAIAIYDDYVAPLKPEDIFLHIGAGDLALFSQDSATFDRKLHHLLQHIRSTDKACHITVISLKSPDANPLIWEMNKHLATIAESEQCDFFDISKHRVWNPQQTKDVLSFVYSTGFVRPLRRKHPLYDLAKILFCFPNLPC